MITDAIKKWRIDQLYVVIWRMNNANAKIKDLNNSLAGLNKLLGENIKINDVGIYKDAVNGFIGTEQAACNTITGRIVPSLYYTIKKMKEEIGG